jgi:hypothetical protein
MLQAPLEKKPAIRDMQRDKKQQAMQQLHVQCAATALVPSAASYSLQQLRATAVVMLSSSIC